MRDVDDTSVRDRVRAYYEHNSAAFEQFGQGGAAIRRAVWGRGVGSRREAFAHVDDLVAEQAAAFAQPRLLDLGCGLGASLVHLARLLPSATGVGVTLSAKQAARARELILRASLADRLRCVEGDYLSLPDDLGSFDVAFAIESFVHTPDAEAFFASAARRLRAGGRLIVCDDFRAREARGRKEQRWLEWMKNGWMIHTLVTAEEARELGRRSGLALVESRDLTRCLELGRPRDLLLAALLALGRPFRPTGSRWRSWMGGDALQRALSSGLVAYRFLVFELSE